eukprot:CAMPEP_0197194770 /NCGR_PEP_ID=MMETSP1423-20130617/29845_1 /TAXON_ID=476441 /ORGANISM="Pseudo-nitzschia heimii, Strain UNC1101" /LENGTH=315 /DNA_ID=CAMNT_0042648249 /DNA_START=148 /DNA_END=1093 /DNA_ORIENTATION=-
MTKKLSDMTVSVSNDASEQPVVNDESGSPKNVPDTVDSEDDEVDAIKNLAEGYLDGSKMKKKECCPEDQQKETADGKSSCPCPSDHHHDHEQAIPEGMPSEMGRQLAAAPSVSVLILGDSGVGKTSFLNRHMTGQPTIEHEPTTSIGVAQIVLPTNHGFIKLHTIDTIGTQPMGGLEKDYFHAVQCVIIMFDVTNPKSYKNATKKWLREVDSIDPNLPKILLGNKADLEAERQIQREDITFHKKNNRSYFDLSVKDMTNIEIPFLCLLLKITGIQDLRFVQMPEAAVAAADKNRDTEPPKPPPGLKTGKCAIACV